MIALTPATAPADDFLAGSRADCEAICVGGKAITVERYNPSGLAHAFTGRRPAVIILHGSDGMTDNVSVYREAACGLAKAGYVVFLPHYFGVTPAAAARGYVDPKEISGRNFVAWQSVVRCTINLAASQREIDSTRIGLLGFSLGSYLAVAEGATNPTVSAIVEFFGGIPPQLAKHVPCLPPTLILHGEADEAVPVTEAYRLQNALASRGTYHDMVIYPNAGHILSPAYRDHAAGRVLQFLQCTL